MDKDAAGNLFLTGYFSNPVDFDPDTSVVYNVSSISNQDIFLVKLDPNENFLWVKQWEYNFPEGSGNGGQEEGAAMTLDASGNVCLAGRFRQTTDFDPGTGVHNLSSNGQAGFALKLDNDGNFLWVKNLVSDTSAGSQSYPRSIATDASGNFYIAGAFNGTVDFDPDSVAEHKLVTDTIQSGFVMKLAADGSFQWAKKVGGVDNPLSSYNYANAVAVDGASNVLLAGSFMGTVSMGSSTLVSNGYSDMFIAKLDAGGNYLWAKGIGNTWDSDRATRITLDAASNVYVSGTYRGTVDFDPGASVKNMTSVGNVDAFLLKLTTNGDFFWAKSFGGSDHRELIYSVAANPTSVYTVGRFMTQINCDDEDGYYLNASYLGSGTRWFDGWVAKIDQSTTDISELGHNIDVVIFPNPATSAFSLNMSSLKGEIATITIFDLQGKKLFETKSRERTTTISTTKFITGTYFVKIQTKDKHVYKKLVIVL